MRLSGRCTSWRAIPTSMRGLPKSSPRNSAAEPQPLTTCPSSRISSRWSRSQCGSTRPLGASRDNRSRRQELGGFVLPAQSYVGVVVYALHRHREFWPDPERFDPDRFHPKQATGRHSYCYLPFGAGPRTCIGTAMAMLEIQLVLAQVLQRFKVHLIPGHTLEVAAMATLKPRGGLPVKLSRR